MKLKRVIELDETDRKLLSGRMPMPSRELLEMRKDLGYCGCLAEDILRKAQQPYQIAGIYDYMLVKMNLIEALESFNDYTIGEIRNRCDAFALLPDEIREAMEINKTIHDDIAAKMIKASGIDKIVYNKED